MKGVIALCAKELVIEKFGEETWEKVLKKAGIETEPIILPISNVDDALIVKIVESIATVLNISFEEVLETFGEYWVTVYTQKNYSIFYKRAKSAKEFLLDLDDIHISMTKNMKGATPPHFEYEQPEQNVLIMKYISKRNLINVVIGAIKGIANYYNENINITKIDNTSIKLIFNS